MIISHTSRSCFSHYKAWNSNIPRCFYNRIKALSLKAPFIWSGSSTNFSIWPKELRSFRIIPRIAGKDQNQKNQNSALNLKIILWIANHFTWKLTIFWILLGLKHFQMRSIFVRTHQKWKYQDQVATMLLFFSIWEYQLLIFLTGEIYGKTRFLKQIQLVYPYYINEIFYIFNQA